MDKIALIGFPYDEKSSYEHGPALAPPLIREALHSGSMNFYAESGRSIKGCYDDLGDSTIEDIFDIESTILDQLTDYSKILSLGGDHAITYPIIKALARKYPDLAILHIDAHPDLYQSFEGDPLSHACPFARIMEDKLASRLVQVGIRAANPHQLEQAERFGVEMHQMKDLRIADIKTFDQPLYISLDLDGIDPAHAPGVSHHESGGLTTRQVIDLFQNLDAEVIGGDIVEYNPLRDHKKMTAYLAAKLLKEMMATFIDKR